MSVSQPQALDFKLLPDGRLQHMQDWSPEAAQALAAREGLELTEEHWDIVRVMREFYEEFNISPVRKLLKRAVAERLGRAEASDARLDALFPGGVQHQGTRIAGLPEPLFDAELERGPANEPDSYGADAVTQLYDEIAVGERRYRLHPSGNLVNPGEWSADLAEALARREGMCLTPEHWEVVDFLRLFYFEYGITPMVRLLMKHMRVRFGPMKSSPDYLYRLFPKGPSRQGSRIAGLPEPQGCIDP